MAKRIKKIIIKCVSVKLTRSFINFSRINEKDLIKIYFEHVRNEN